MTTPKLYASVSRIADFLLALGGLLVAAPLLGLLAVAVVAESGRPILYGGVRVGRRGRLFRVWKFRTMVPDAERLGTSVSRHGDPRVTRIGRFLRSSKLDELPQLWNVVKGEMSLVGPRPEAPEIVAGYVASLKPALEVRPGITSIASLWLREETDLLIGIDSPEEIYQTVIVPAKVRLALTHSERRSLLFDWGVLLATAGAGLRLRRPSDEERRFLGGLRAQIAAWQEKRKPLESSQQRPSRP